tara:strand:+ start:275 stop:424 length:150 start_codon:yes stop_codon:yes gene_type:complete
MNVLQQVKGLFKKYRSEADFRRIMLSLSFSVTEEDIVEGYEYIKTLKNK